MHHDDLAHHLGYDRQLKATTLTDEFTFDNFRERYGDSAIVLFTIDEAKKLSVYTPEQASPPQPGQTVIAMIDSVPDQDLDSG